MKKILYLLLLASLIKADEIYATFEAEAVRFSNLSLRASGVIDAIYVDVGERVSKGDLLLTLESSEQKAQLAIALADLDLAQNRLERANAISESISRDELDLHRANYKRAKAQVDYHQAVVNNRVLKAPFDGVIAKRFVHMGDLIERSQNGLFMIVDDTMSKLILSFDQRYLDLVRKDQIYRLKVNGKERNATISEIYPTLERTTRKAHATAYVKGVPHGLFGDGYIEVK